MQTAIDPVSLEILLHSAIIRVMDLRALRDGNARGESGMMNAFWHCREQSSGYSRRPEAGSPVFSRFWCDSCRKPGSSQTTCPVSRAGYQAPTAGSRDSRLPFGVLQTLQLARCDSDRPSVDGCSVAPTWLAPVLTLEMSTGPTADSRRVTRTDRQDGAGESAVG